jgi:hypothetical protein
LGEAAAVLGRAVFRRVLALKEHMMQRIMALSTLLAMLLIGIPVAESQL